MTIEEHKLSIRSAASQIITAWLGANPSRASTVPALIALVHRALMELPVPGAPAPQPLPIGPVPVIDPKRSLFADRVLCIQCGLPFISMRRHLMRAHELTPAAYRKKWKLPSTYPVVAPDYAKARSAMARHSGLGRHRESHAKSLF